MSALLRILRSYLDLDGRLAILEAEARQRRHTKKLTKLQSLRLSTDHAYFMMVFATFESELNQKCIQLITVRQAKTKWRYRRPWDTLSAKPSDIRRIRFKDRLAYCLEMGTTDYQQVLTYYETRNQLSHSATTSTLVVVPQVATDLIRVSTSLQAR
jgi:hypothetical protein